MAIQTLKLKVIPSEEAKSLAADLLAGKQIDSELLKKANAMMGLKIEMQADAETINRVVYLIEHDLGGKPETTNKT